jgi:hypothetical protein
MRVPLPRAALAACVIDFGYSAAFIPSMSPIFFTVTR